MTIGTIVALTLTVYISMFLLMYFLASVYMNVHETRLERSYTDGDIIFTFWASIIVWPVSIPIWSLIFLVTGFGKTTGGILGILDTMAITVAAKFKK